MVDFPLPEGAEKIMILPLLISLVMFGQDFISEYVKHLFFYLFELIFHHYDDALHVGIITFGA